MPLIRNKVTGEVKEVGTEEIPQYVSPKKSESPIVGTPKMGALLEAIAKESIINPQNSSKLKASFDMLSSLEKQQQEKKKAEEKRAKDDKEKNEAYSSFKTNLKKVDTQFGNLDAKDRLLSIIPFNLGERLDKDVGSYNTIRTQLGYDLARLRDKGVLNKQDVEYAISALPSGSYSKETGQAKIKAIQDYLNGKLGIEEKDQEPNWEKLLQQSGL